MEDTRHVCVMLINVKLMLLCALFIMKMDYGHASNSVKKNVIGFESLRQCCAKANKKYFYDL